MLVVVRGKKITCENQLLPRTQREELSGTGMGLGPEDQAFSRTEGGQLELQPSL